MLQVARATSYGIHATIEGFRCGIIQLHAHDRMGLGHSRTLLYQNGVVGSTELAGVLLVLATSF